MPRFYPAPAKNHEILVREQVEIDDLRIDLKRAQAGLQRQQAVLPDLRKELSQKNPSPSAARQQALLKELASRFATFQLAEATLDAKLEQIRRREKDLAQAKEKQAELLEMKHELDAEVANLEARLELLRIEPVSQRPDVNDQQLAESFESIHYVRKRSAVAKRLTESNAKIDDRELEFATSDIEKEIDRYFAERENPAPRGHRNG